MGRFINADGYTSTGQGLLGNNMFAYCGNNAIINTDFSGYKYYHALELADGGISSGIPSSTGVDSSDSFSAGSSGSLRRKITETIHNEDETVVLQSNIFSFYKGTLVVKTNFKRSGSFGIIFLQDDIASIPNPEDMIRHEYGHTKQLERLGVVKYSLCIFLPSWQEWGSDEYYQKPWEVTADILGGVQSRSPSEEKTIAGFEYLDMSCGLGPVAWATIN